MPTKPKLTEHEIVFEPDPALGDVELVPEEKQAEQPDEDKMVRPVEDKAFKAEPKPRWAWDAISAEGRQAAHGHWRVRVQQLGATGLFRPFVEYVGDDYKTEDGAEKALERLLK